VLARPHRLDDADGIYLRVGGQWRYLYRAVDGTGQTVGFLLGAKRDKQAAKRFFRRALSRENTRNPRTVVTDRLQSYPGALREMKRDDELWRFTRHRRGQWLNNAGQGTGARRARQRPAGAASFHPPGIRPRGLTRATPTGGPPSPANATDPWWRWDAGAAG
jgi:transposase-like protein